MILEDMLGVVKQNITEKLRINTEGGQNGRQNAFRIAPSDDDDDGFDEPEHSDAQTVLKRAFHECLIPELNSSSEDEDEDDGHDD